MAAGQVWAQRRSGRADSVFLVWGFYLKFTFLRRFVGFSLKKKSFKASDF